MTKQHVFPDRLRHVLPRIPNATRSSGVRNRTVRDGKIVKADVAEKQSQGNPGQFRIRRVCRSCNEGWLKAMESDCFPLVEELILGATPVLRRPDQEKLAKAAMSIALVGEWITDTQISTKQEEREFFRQKLYPPPGWFVFLGKDGTNSQSPRFLSDGCTNSGKFGRKTPVKEFSSFTMTMGHVLLHTISLRDGLYFNVDKYSHHLGLAAICPSTDWINFALMPALQVGDIARIRTYATIAFRQMNG